MNQKQKTTLATEIRGYANAIAATDITSRLVQHLKDLEKLARIARQALEKKQ